MFFDNERATSAKEILFVKIENDGFDLGATKRPITKNDLPQALEIINQWKTGKKSESKLAVYVEKSNIGKTGDYNLSGDRYRVATDYSNAKWPMVLVKDVAFFQEGPGILSSQYVSAGYPMVNVRNVQDGYLDLKETKFISDEMANNKWAHFRIDENDILFTTSGTIGRVAIVKKQDLPLMLNTSVVRFRPLNKQELNTNYLYYSLRSEQFINELLRLKTGSGQFNVGPTHIKTLKIPLPPLEIQEQIVAELDSCQKIIDGAKQIAANWKPKIDIDPKWEKIKIGDEKFIQIIDGDRGGNYPSKEEFEPNGYCLFLNTSNVRKGDFDFSKCDFITRDKDKSLRKGKLNREDIVLTTRGTLGNTAHYSNDIAFENIRINSGMVILRCSMENVSPNYLLQFLNSVEFNDQVSNFMSGSAQPQLPIGVLSKIEIPIPSLEAQKQIVEKIESERMLVESAKKLITIYEQKTKETIGKLWEK